MSTSRRLWIALSLLLASTFAVLLWMGSEIHRSAPSYDDVYAQLNEERMNSRARRYRRDLRRDAVIEFR